ncbi:hypothetical protein [Ancylobacter sp.]|uniref:hypothetical protein n=1 Tax=Ancylobacter sp. TaxID=1872567 RepID=UPI003D0E4551
MITVGLLTTPLPFVMVGAVGGALVATIAGAFVAEFAARRRDRADNALRAASARMAIGLRYVIQALDQGEDPAEIRAIASRHLNPCARLRSGAVIPLAREARHG